MPLVSIVLPTFNGSRYLRESVDSVIEQTFTDWELILVNDCSTDETPQIAESYAQGDSRIQVHHNEKNLRLPRSLNAGFDRATGSFLTWTSDDNLFRPTALQRMVETLESLPEIDLVYSNQSVIDDDGNLVGQFIGGPPQSVWLENPVNASFMYRRHVHETLGGYDPDLFLLEDWDFWQRCSSRFKMHKLEEDLYLYRQHAGSLSSTRQEQVKRTHLTMMAKNLPHAPLPQPLKGEMFAELAYMTMYFNDRKQAGRYLRQAFRLGGPRALLKGKTAWLAYLLGYKAAGKLQILLGKPK